MKYWIITTEFPPFHGGGISTYNLHTGLMLVEMGHSVTVFVPDHDVQQEGRRDTYKGIEVIRFKPGTENYAEFLGYATALSFQFSEIIIDEITSKGKPDFIETQDYHGIGYYLIQRKKLGEPLLQEVPIVLTAHAPSYFYLDHNQAPVFSLPEFWNGEMEKWTMQAADILISPSQYLVENVAEHLNGADQDYHVVRNPYKNLVEKSAEPRFDTDDIVFFGKLTYQKGALQLLGYLSDLWDKGLDKPVSFIGDDHFFEPLQVNMRDHLISKYRKYYEKGLFRFEGKLNLEQLDDRLAKASLIIVPSIVDNFPYAVVESMLMRRVLLISDGGGQREMIEDGISGFIYKNGSSDSFAEKFQQAIALTPARREQMGNAAQARISELCNYQRVYQQKKAILDSFSEKKKKTDFPFIYHLPKSELKIKGEEKKGTLSVIVPYFNTGKYIAETVQNIFEVIYTNKEVIIVNDGSTDPESIAVLNRLKQEYPIKVIDQKNQGLAQARNTGIRNATGEYVAFLDADDKIHPDFYGRAIQLIQKYPNLSFVSSWVQYFDASDGVWPSLSPEPPLQLLMNLVNAGFLCKRSDYLNFAENDSAFKYGMEDYDANLSLMENGCRGVVIPEPLYYYRIHAASMARGFNKFNKLYSYRMLSKKHRALYEKYAYQTFNLLLANGPSYLYDNPTLTPSVSEVIESSGGLNNTSVINPFTGAYRELRRWYHQDYHLMPLWFKRTVSLVKIMRGKKNLKSLIKR